MSACSTSDEAENPRSEPAPNGSDATADDANRPPAVSVVMCTYNGAPYLIEQLDSIAAQSAPPDEVIVVDDASTDETPALLRDYAARSPLRIRLHVNSVNLGYRKNFAQAMSLASGDLLFLCDQDDTWHPDKIRVFREAFAAAPSAALAYGDSNLVDSALAPLGTTLWQLLGVSSAERAQLAGDAGFEIAVRRGNFFCGCSMAMTRDFRDLALPFPETVPHDLWLGNLASALGGLVLVDTPLLNYRQHAAQTSGDKTPTLGTRVRRWRRAARMFSDTRYYDLWIAEHAALRDRLVALGRAETIAVALLDQKIRYLECQRIIHARTWLGRLPVIADQLRSGRHRRFGRGWKSLLVDFIG